MLLWPKVASLLGWGGFPLPSVHFSCILTSNLLLVSTLKWIDSQKIAATLSAFFVHFKRPSPPANKLWRTPVGQRLVCVKDTTIRKQKFGDNRDEFYFSPTDCQHVAVSFRHTNLSLSKRVGQHLFVV